MRDPVQFGIHDLLRGCHRTGGIAAFAGARFPAQKDAGEPDRRNRRCHVGKYTLRPVQHIIQLVATRRPRQIGGHILQQIPDDGNLTPASPSIVRSSSPRSPADIGQLGHVFPRTGAAHVGSHSVPPLRSHRTGPVHRGAVHRTW